MKSLLTATALTLIATTAFAGSSDRYKDLRLDTSASTQNGTSKGVVAARANTKAPLPRVTFSSMGKSKTSKPYAYQSPYGVGPSNDSR